MEASTSWPVCTGETTTQWVQSGQSVQGIQASPNNEARIGRLIQPTHWLVALQEPRGANVCATCTETPAFSFRIFACFFFFLPGAVV